MKSKLEWFRLILAAVISPSVPMFALASTMSWISGSDNWFPIVFMFGYLFFCLLGLPIIGILVQKRTLISCLIGGGAATIAPVLLLSVFSIPSFNNVYGGRMLFDLLVLFLIGGFGGLLFWGIAFAGMKQKIIP